MIDEPSAIGVDFHCHLDLYPDHEAVIERAEAARVHTLSVTTTPKAWERNRALTRGTRFVRASLGLHPQLVAERAGELPLLERLLPEACYVGEVGLDAGPRFYKSLEVQKRAFRRILERCKEAGGKILSVHSVRSVSDVLEMIERHLPRDRGGVVLHWFTGRRSELVRAVALGCYFSVNSEMTRSVRGISLVAQMPLDRILTETDGPFTAINARPTEPADVRAAVVAIARIRNLPVDRVATLVLANHQALLRMNFAEGAE